jgi:tape measure domain-containing protein
MSASGIRAGKAFVEIGANSAPLSAALARISGRINAFGAGLGKLAMGAAAVGAGAGALLAWPLKLASDLEQSTAKFTTMLGSADAATKMLKSIREMAAATPFETADLISAGETLLNFGVSAEEILPTLQKLGDASGGNAERFQSLALVFGQVAANGRLMGGDVLQMVNAGFNPLMEIAQRTGESMTDLRKRMEQGGIGIDEVKQAFTDATGPGGRFFGLMDAQSKTLAGRFSTLKDSIAEALMPLGEYLLPIMKTAVSAATAAIQNIGAAWEIGIAGIDLGWRQLTGGMGEWVSAFQDVWTDAVTWIAQTGSSAFSGLAAIWDGVSTSIAGAVDYIWSKLKQLIELMQIAGESIGVLETSQGNEGKSTSDRLGAISAEQQARAKAREKEFEARQADRLRDKQAMLKQLADMGEAEKRARRGVDPRAEAEKRMAAAQAKFNALVGEVDAKQSKRQEQLKKSGDSAKPEAESKTSILGQFNASLAGQQVGLKAVQDRIAKATEATAKGVQGLADAGSGVVVT